MYLFDLSRRVKGTILKISQKFNKRRIFAYLLLGKSTTFVIVWSFLPILGLNADQANISTAWAKEAGENQVVTIPSLVLDTTAIDPLQLAQAQFKITKVESRAEEKRRLARTNQSPVIYVAIAEPSLEEKRALAQKAADVYGIDWKILEAVWQVESGKRWSTPVASYAGARGPMQFMPGTWRRYGVDGNGDGVADITHAEDAVFAGAALLAANGGATNIDKALFAYNHATWYVQKVKRVAESI